VNSGGRTHWQSAVAEFGYFPGIWSVAVGRGRINKLHAACNLSGNPDAA